MGFLKKRVAFGVPPAYSRYRRLRPPVLAFIEQTRKENNTYFIDLLIIENVEFLNLKGFCGESVLYRRNWTCHLHDV